jgi:SAM-dependent methyltransferase
VDADDYRRESREGWNRAAAGWLATADQQARATMPVSERLVDALAPQPGHQLLELAAGTGEVGMLLAELVAPGGEVVISDFAPGMLDAAQQRAAGRGLDNVRFKQIDAESIDLAAASLDGVVCRWGLMLMADPEAALREVRRVLRPGRPLSFAVWTAPAENPWRALLDEALTGAPPATEAPGMFGWSDRALIEAHLEAAGFLDHVIEPVDLAFRYGSIAEWIATTRQISRRFDEALSGHEERVATVLAETAAPYMDADGALVLPGRNWVAWAAA